MNTLSSYHNRNSDAPDSLRRWHAARVLATIDVIYVVPSGFLSHNEGRRYEVPNSLHDLDLMRLTF